MKKFMILTGLVFVTPELLQAQCFSVFYDGFESGSYLPTWTSGSGLTATVTTTNPAVGTYRLEGTGGNSSHLNGLSTTFTSATPNRMSWWMNPNGTVSVNYFVAGDASMTPTNCIVFCYFYGAGQAIRFVSSVTFDHSATQNTWYFIELQNINWTMHTFDIYINNTLVYPSFPFRSSTQNNVSRVHLYNFNTGVGYWDDIQIGVANIPVISGTSTPVTCPGGNNGSANISVTGGNPGYTYSWSNGATTEDLTGVTAGTYSVTVTDANACSVTFSVTITQPPPFIASVLQSNVTCPGGTNGSVMVTAYGGSPPHTYAWSTGATSPGLTNISAGMYTCTVTDMNGCTTTATVTITEPPPFSITVSQTPVSCNGGSNGAASVTVNGGTPGYSYNWSGGGNSASISGLTAGTYTCTITDASGCVITQSILITQPGAMMVSPTVTSPTCGGDADGSISVMVSGGIPGYTYSWSSGGNTPGLSNIVAGTYSVTITDANNCTLTQSIQVTEPSPVTTSLTSFPISCNGSMNGIVYAIVMGGNGSYTYAWSNGSTQSMINNLGPMTGTVVVTDGNGCMDSATFALAEPDPIILNTSAVNPTTCSSADGSIDLTSSGGTPPYSYSWSQSATTEDLAGLTDGTYSVLLTDAHGCTESATVTLSDPNPPAVSLSLALTVLCVTDAAQALSGGMPTGGAWSGNGVSGTFFNPVVAGAGLQVITYSYTDQNGCTGNASDSILVDPCVGYAEIVKDNDWYIYPNPVIEKLFISGTCEPGLVEIELYAGDGRKVLAEKITARDGRQTFIVDISAHPAGVYLVRIISNGTVNVYKVIRD